jgi:hypothetical protein
MFGFVPNTVVKNSYEIEMTKNGRQLQPIVRYRVTIQVKVTRANQRALVLQ